MLNYKVIYPYSIFQWHFLSLVRIAQKTGVGAEKNKSLTKLGVTDKYNLQKETLLVKSKIYRCFIPNMNKKSLNSFSYIILPKTTGSTFATDFYSMDCFLKLITMVSRNVTIWIYTNTKIAL